MAAEPSFDSVLRDIRNGILGADGFPLSPDRQEQLRDYDLHAAAPDQGPVEVAVDVRVRRPEGDAGERRRRIEITPEVVIDSPSGRRYFAGWNDVAETFVIWFTDDALRALDGRLGTERLPPELADRARELRP